jgi:DNA-binding transcriptional LysR family regulator
MNWDLDWNDLKAFLAVLDSGSLSAAARLLGVAQPTIRNRVEALERQLGATLFTRSVRGLTPTALAAALADHARTMSLAANSFARAASATPGEISGVVRLSVSEFIGVEVLPAMLRSIRDRYPRVIVELALSNAAVDLLRQEADIAVRMHPPQQEALVARKIGVVALGFFAHVDYLARRGEPQAISDLASHKLIGSDRARTDLELARNIHPAIRREQFLVRTDSHPAQLAAARAGLGIAVVQRPVGRADPVLRPVLPEYIVAELPIWLVTHEDLRSTPRVRAVFDQLAIEFTRFVAYGQGQTAAIEDLSSESRQGASGPTSAVHSK